MGHGSTETSDAAAGWSRGRMSGWAKWRVLLEIAGLLARATADASGAARDGAYSHRVTSPTQYAHEQSIQGAVRLWSADEARVAIGERVHVREPWLKAVFLCVSLLATRFYITLHGPYNEGVGRARWARGERVRERVRVCLSQSDCQSDRAKRQITPILSDTLLEHRCSLQWPADDSRCSLLPSAPNWRISRPSCLTPTLTCWPAIGHHLRLSSRSGTFVCHWAQTSSRSPPRACVAHNVTTWPRGSSPHPCLLAPSVPLCVTSVKLSSSSSISHLPTFHIPFAMFTWICNSTPTFIKTLSVFQVSKVKSGSRQCNLFSIWVVPFKMGHCRHKCYRPPNQTDGQELFPIQATNKG